MCIRDRCGRALEQLAGTWESKQNVKVCMKGRDCCLSGFENKAKDLYAAGESPQKIAPVSYTHLDMYKRQANTIVPACYNT